MLEYRNMKKKIQKVTLQTSQKNFLGLKMLKTLLPWQKVTEYLNVKENFGTFYEK